MLTVGDTTHVPVSELSDWTTVGDTTHVPVSELSDW